MTAVPARRQVLVAGATGIVGGAAVEHFAREGWDVLALSRRQPAPRAGVTHLALDLLDADACQAARAALGGVTHLVYAALYEKPDLVAGWRDPGQMDTNLVMLRNLMDALAGGPLQHVTLLQGTKAYGLHHVQVPVPAKERWPRAPHDVFYWLQEDLLKERQPGSGWTYTILRPQLILGNAIGSPMNLVAALGVYAATLRELGEPLRFPGGGRYVHAASDSRLIAQAAAWAATSPVAANETYNVVNGDMLVWQDLWPAVAAHFGMDVGDPRPMRLAEDMPRHEGAWQRVVERHDLVPVPWSRLVGSSWQFTDRTFGYGLDKPLDRIESPVKLWQAGFTGCMDTEDAVIHWLSRMQSERLLPR